MGKLGSYTIGVIEEGANFSVKATQYPVEKGVSITDHVERELETFALTGKVTGDNAAKAEEYFKKMQYAGKPVTYVGRMRLKSVLITNFTKKQNNKIANGFIFSMDLQEVRVAKSSVVRKKKKGTGTNQKKPKGKPSSKSRYYVVKKGDTLWDIATKYYGKPDYRTIYNSNKDKVRDPDLIYPGQKFLIPYK